MVLDFSMDGGYLGPSRLDLISRLIGTPDVRLNYEPHRLLHEFTLFGMTLDDLKQGADAGCLPYALMMEEGNYWGNIESIYDCTPSTPAFAARLFAGDRFTFGILKMDLNDEGELNHEYTELFDFVFQILAGSQNPAARDFGNRPANVDPASESSFSLARSWLDSCLTSHPSCAGPTREITPTRLVEIVSTQGEQNLRLRETKPGDKEPFAALSYCWGEEQLFTTTRHTLSQLIKGFGIQDLPPSLRDAVIATEKLGLHFIWVDALCIVQDDDYDKASEIARMPAIYNQAAVTIVASRAADVNDGFLGPRTAFGATNPREVFDLPYRCKDGILGSVTLIREVERSREPLDRRAWALQERLLSPRILDYGTYQTEWICQVSQKEKSPTDGWVDYHLDYWDKKTKERWDLLLLQSRALLDSCCQKNDLSELLGFL